MLRCLHISYAKIVRNIWKLSGHADFLNFFYFYHSTFGTFDPRLEAVWKSKLLISLMPYFVFRSITKIVLILSIFEDISRLCQNITLWYHCCSWYYVAHCNVNIDRHKQCGNHIVQKLRVIFNKLLYSFDCFLSLYDKHTYIKNLK